MAVGFSTISGTTYPACLSAFKHLWDIQSWMAVSFSIISGTSHPAWLWAFQPLLEQPWTFEACLEACLKHPILHGCDMAVAFQTSLEYLSCMAVKFSRTWTSYPAWLSALQPSLEQPILHGCELSSISGTSNTEWLSAFQSSLVNPTLHDCELSNHCWNNLEPSKHVWKHVWSILSWMAVTWLWTFQTSLEYLSCMAVNFSSISGHPILRGC